MQQISNTNNLLIINKDLKKGVRTMKIIIASIIIIGSLMAYAANAITLYECSGGGAIVTNPTDC